MDSALRVGKVSLKQNRPMQRGNLVISANENLLTPLGPSLQEPSSFKYEGLHQKLSSKYNQNPNFAQPIIRAHQVPGSRMAASRSNSKKNLHGSGPDIKGISVAANIR